MSRTVRLAVLALSALFVTPSLAQSSDPFAPPRSYRSQPTKGVQIYDGRMGANVRAGTTCRLVLNGEDILPDGRGICNVSRGLGKDRERVSVIDIGDGITYRIVRDEDDNTSGRFYVGGRMAGLVEAQGECWRGRTVKFCAK